MEVPPATEGYTITVRLDAVSNDTVCAYISAHTELGVPTSNPTFMLASEKQGWDTI